MKFILLYIPGSEINKIEQRLIEAEIGLRIISVPNIKFSSLAASQMISKANWKSFKKVLIYF